MKILLIIPIILLVGCGTLETRTSEFVGAPYIRDTDGRILYYIDEGNPTYIRSPNGRIQAVK